MRILYQKHLNKVDLMDLWEYGRQSVKEIGTRLYLDSGTLTPLLKKLEKKLYHMVQQLSCFIQELLKILKEVLQMMV